MNKDAIGAMASQGEGVKFKLPHQYVIVFSFILLVAVATWVIPAGEFAHKKPPEDHTAVRFDTYHRVAQHPAGLMDVLEAPLFGIKESAETVAFVLIVGGVFAIISETGAFHSGMLRIVNAFKGRERFFIPICLYAFSAWGALLGLQEVIFPLIGLFVPLCVAMGYDRITGLAVTYGGVTVVFSSAVFNPFNLGLAQTIAGVPLFTGALYRFLLWFIFTAITTVFVMRYARRSVPKRRCVRCRSRKRTHCGVCRLESFGESADPFHGSDLRVYWICHDPLGSYAKAMVS
jgi:uncharacterized ion transporter superfamily protein YfcC